MEFKLECLYKMPLKDLAARRVAILLCNHTNMYAFAGCMKNKSKPTYERATNDVLSEILATIELPVSTKNELINIMKHVFREIIKWINFHEGFLEPDDVNLARKDILELLRWTRVGTVKYQETAAALIRRQMLRIEICYKLACLYCFEEDIRDLWRRMPTSSKKLFYSNNPLHIEQPKIVVIWTFIIKNRVNELVVFLRQDRRRYHSIYQYSFEYAASQGYRAATQHFFERLTPQEIGDSLERTATSVAKMRSFDCRISLHEDQKYGDVLFFLMYQMPRSKRHSFYSSLPFEILKCLLDWPWQDMFVGHANYVFDWCKTLTPEDYCRLFYFLTRNITSGYHYLELHRTFFLLSPKKLRDTAVTQYACFLHELMSNEEKEAIKFIFRHVNSDEKVQIAFSIKGMFELSYNWELLQLVFNEARLSKENREEILSSFLPHFSKIPMQHRGHFSELMNKVDAGQSTSECPKDAETPLPSTEKHPDDELTASPNKILKQH